MTEASYDIIIPGKVRRDGRLGLYEQVLYGEIRGLCRLEGFCWASNTLFAKRLAVSTRSIPRWLRTLEKCGHIKVHWTPDNRNLRKITLTEGMTGQSYPMTDVSGGMTGQRTKGMTGQRKGSAGIRKKVLNTTTPMAAEDGNPKSKIQNPKRGDDGFDLSKIPKPAIGGRSGGKVHKPVGEGIAENGPIPRVIAQRFGLRKTLRAFFENCGGDIGLMERYLAKADGMKLKNPVGMAVRMAEDYRRDGPPGDVKLKQPAARGQPAGRDERKHLGATP